MTWQCRFISCNKRTTEVRGAENGGVCAPVGWGVYGNTCLSPSVLSTPNGRSLLLGLQATSGPGLSCKNFRGNSYTDLYTCGASSYQGPSWGTMTCSHLCLPGWISAPQCPLQGNLQKMLIDYEDSWPHLYPQCQHCWAGLRVCTVKNPPVISVPFLVQHLRLWTETNRRAGALVSGYHENPPGVKVLWTLNKYFLIS